MEQFHCKELLGEQVQFHLEWEHSITVPQEQLLVTG